MCALRNYVDTVGQVIFGDCTGEDVCVVAKDTITRCESQIVTECGICALARNLRTTFS